MVLRVLPSVGVNLMCCFSRLNDSLETHLLDIGAQRETERRSQKTFKDIICEQLALWLWSGYDSDVYKSAGEEGMNKFDFSVFSSFEN